MADHIELSERSMSALWERERGDSSKKIDPKLIRRIISENLSARQRDYLTLYYFGGMKMREIAKLRGIGSSTVSRTIKRGEKRLAAVLRYMVRR